VVAQLIRNGTVQHAYLGFDAAPITPDLARLFNLPTGSGLLLQQVVPGSPAAQVGLRVGTTPVIVEGETYLLGGDIVVAADGAPVSTTQQLRDLIARKKPGDRLSLEIYRDGKRKSIEVRLGQHPS